MCFNPFGDESILSSLWWDAFFEKALIFQTFDFLRWALLSFTSDAAIKFAFPMLRLNAGDCFFSGFKSALEYVPWSTFVIHTNCHRLLRLTLKKMIDFVVYVQNIRTKNISPQKNGSKKLLLSKNIQVHLSFIGTFACWIEKCVVTVPFGVLKTALIAKVAMEFLIMFDK